jgi:hypothetical protein
MRATYNRQSVFAHVPKVRILPAPPNDVIMLPMKKKLVVEKKKFDAVLSQLLKMKPLPMKQLKTRLKTRGRKGSKAPIIPPK